MTNFLNRRDNSKILLIPLYNSRYIYFANFYHLFYSFIEKHIYID